MVEPNRDDVKLPGALVKAELPASVWPTTHLTSASSHACLSRGELGMVLSTFEHPTYGLLIMVLSETAFGWTIAALVSGL